MTRFEQLKPGMAFLFGEEKVKTIDDAAQLAYEIIDCLWCPYHEKCESKVWDCDEDDPAPLEECRRNHLAYLSEEVE